MPYAEPFTPLFLRFVLALLLLAPPVTAVEAWLLFGEPLRWIKIAGIALVALGVWLVMRRKSPVGELS